MSALHPVSLVGSEPEPGVDVDLWTAREVGAYLRIPAKKVYELPMPRVTLSARRVRFLKSDVFAFVQRHRRTG